MRDIFFYIFYIFLAIFVVSLFASTDRACKKCGSGKLKLKKITTPFGYNVSNRIILLLYMGPRKYTETLVCDKCGNSVTIKTGSPE